MVPVPHCVLDKMAKLFDTTASDLAFLGGGKEFSDGIVYSFTKGNKPYALKILSVLKSEKDSAFMAITERLKFVRFAGEQGVGIIHPLANGRGAFMETVEDDAHIFIGYTMDKLDGALDFSKAYNPEFNKKYGQTIGQLHRAAKAYPLWKGSGVDGDCPVLGWRQEVDFFIGWCQDVDVKACWREMKGQLEEMPYDRGSFGFIHNDVHLGNVMLLRGKLFLIDFDVANFHWFMNDVVTAAQGLYHLTGGFDRPLEKPDVLKSFFHEFMEGYEKENHLDNAWLKKMDVFLQYRRMLLFTAMQEMIGSSPDWKSSYKGMILNKPEIGGQVFNL